MPAAERITDHVPFLAGRLDERFAPLKAHGRAALAVSGGGDSVALMVLVSHWLKAHGRHGAKPDVTVLTVDHGLRRESVAEARQTGRWAHALGFSHQVLNWAWAAPKRGLQAAAREARYRLMIDWCLENDASALLLGHNLDDQAETLMMRLARGSGVDGLAAMAPVTVRSGVELVRPLLDLSRDELRTMLKAAGQGWIEDPSNQDPAFERVRVRRLLARLDAEGMTADMLAASARRMTRARRALDEMAHRACLRHVHVYAGGFTLCNREALLAEPDECVLRVLKTCLAAVGGSVGPLRLDRLEALHEALSGPDFRPRTLGGCRVSGVHDFIMIVREPGRRAPEPLALAPGGRGVWDRRYEIALDAKAASPVTVATLGARGQAQLAEYQNIPKLPAACLRALPALWRGDRLAAVPYLGVGADEAGMAPLSVSFIGASAGAFALPIRNELPELAAGAEKIFAQAFSGGGLK